MKRIYMDHNATTPLREAFCSASSPHSFGRQARRAIEDAREQVAAALGAQGTF